MKKCFKFLIPIAVLVFIFRNPVFKILNDSSSINFFSSIGSMGDLLSSIVSILNIMLIIDFYEKDKSFRAKEQTVQTKVSWYRTIVLDKNFKTIDDFFERISIIIQESKALIVTDRQAYSATAYNIALKSKIEDYTIEKIKIDQNLNDIIRAMDDSLAIKLDKLSMEYQDKFVTKLAELSMLIDNHDFTRLETQVFEYKRELFKLLYNYELSISK